MQATKTAITLKGSVDIVTEFFAYSINSILFQRGVYGAEDFRREEHYGLPLYVAKDAELCAYIGSVVGQLRAWLAEGVVQRLVLVVTGLTSKAPLERWSFSVETTKPMRASSSSSSSSSAAAAAASSSDKPLADIQAEIRAIIRQITASVTFLPLIDEPCAFDLLVYADARADVPPLWEESDPCYIPASQEVRLRSFSTKIHKVDAAVSFRVTD